MSFILKSKFLPTVQVQSSLTSKSIKPIQTRTNTNTHTIISDHENLEIRVCTNRTCRKQGSMTTLDTLIGIAPPHVLVKPCGCLGRCGAGPNLVVLPKGVLIGHCGTPVRAAEIMVHFCGFDGGNFEGAVREKLDGLAMRKRTDVKLKQDNLPNVEN